MLKRHKWYKAKIRKLIKQLLWLSYIYVFKKRCIADEIANIGLSRINNQISLKKIRKSKNWIIIRVNIN